MLNLIIMKCMGHYGSTKKKKVNLEEILKIIQVSLILEYSLISPFPTYISCNRIISYNEFYVGTPYRKHKRNALEQRRNGGMEEAISEDNCPCLYGPSLGPQRDFWGTKQLTSYSAFCTRHANVAPATWKAEVGESLELKSPEPPWAKQ
jgi:hypothetical protein